MEIREIIKDNYGHFSEEELKDLMQVMRVCKLKKNEVFVECGKKNRIGFVLSGSLYACTVDELGNEKIDDLFFPKEKHFVFNYESYLLNKPLEVSIQANENSTLFVGSVHDIKNLYKVHPRLYQVEISIIQQHLLLAMHKIKILQQHDPSLGLRLMQSHFPHVFRHFSFSQIASFLGIHRNTLTNAMKKL